MKKVKKTINYKNQKIAKLQKKQYESNEKKSLYRKQKESNKEKKQIGIKQKRENMVEDFDISRFFELATSNKLFVKSLNLHEIKNQILQDYTGDFKLNGLMIIGSVENKTNIRFKKMYAFGSYINAMDIDYDSEDVTFNGYVRKLNTPQFNVVKRSVYGKGTDYMQEIVEYHGQNCYIPTSGHCFIRCKNYSTNKDYTEEILFFTRTEQKRSN